MKNLFKTFVLMLLICIIPTGTVKAAVKLNIANAEIKVGETLSLKVTGTKKKVKWSSSNKDVATVTKKGKVTAKQVGAATITAKIARKTLKCIITIVKSNTKPTVDTTEKLSEKTYITKDKFIVEYTNNGNLAVYIKPFATFLDADGNKVAVMLPDNGNLIISPSQTAYSLYEISSEEYISAETSVNFEDLNELIAYKDCLEIETIDKEKEVDCIIKNISNNTISANIVAIFKDNIGNIVYATTVDNEEDSMSEFYLKSGESSITSFYKPYDILYEDYSVVYYAYN